MGASPCRGRSSQRLTLARLSSGQRCRCAPRLNAPSWRYFSGYVWVCVAVIPLAWLGAFPAQHVPALGASLFVLEVESPGTPAIGQGLAQAPSDLSSTPPAPWGRAEGGKCNPVQRRWNSPSCTGKGCKPPAPCHVQATWEQDGQVCARPRYGRHSHLHSNPRRVPPHRVTACQKGTCSEVPESKRRMRSKGPSLPPQASPSYISAHYLSEERFLVPFQSLKTSSHCLSSQKEKQEAWQLLGKGLSAIRRRLFCFCVNPWCGCTCEGSSCVPQEHRTGEEGSKKSQTKGVEVVFFREK